MDETLPPCCMTFKSKDEGCYCAQNYAPLPVILERGEGPFLYDTDGNRYFDCTSAYSAVNHGHCHPDLIQAATEQMGKLTITSRAYSSNLLCVFMKKLCNLLGYEAGLATNSGVEAVETAIKVARKWGYQHKGVADSKAQIIVAANNFHGRTLTVVSFSSCEQYKDGFGPLTPGFVTIPYNDASALADAITENTVAFLVEPIQGEGGIIIPDSGYLKACQEICTQNKVLFICDEIQTGLGRTGTLLACEHDGIKPDAVIMGKSLGGGLYPVSAFLTTKDVMDVMTPGDHGSTFGGNPLACAIAMKALDVLEAENLCSNSKELGAYFMTALKTIDSPAIKEVRGKGLMIGLELNTNVVDAHTMAIRLMHAGLLTKETHDTVLRLAPPLVITKSQIDEMVEIIKTCLHA